MDYHVLGKEISIYTMEKPKGGFGSVFEFTGSDSLNEIGLNQKFWFKYNHGFSNALPISENQTELVYPKDDYQRVLAIFLEKCIRNQRLTNQYEEPAI
jgi:hypothetical protein